MGDPAPSFHVTAKVLAAELVGADCERREVLEIIGWCLLWEHDTGNRLADDDVAAIVQLAQEGSTREALAAGELEMASLCWLAY